MSKTTSIGGTSWKTLVQLARHDIRARYAGATLGFFWSIIQPLVMTIILWFVFTFAWPAGAREGVPLIVWLLPGMAAWSFFAEAMNNATGVLQEYAFLVKKMRFPVIMLPPMKILSALATHLIFLGITVIVLLINGVTPSIHWLQLPFYLVGMLILLTGAGWITAALHALSRDVGYIVNVLLQFGFWLTPVFWSPEMMSGYPRLAWAAKLNPLYYIVEGYRQTLVLRNASAPSATDTGIFWLTALLVVVLGLAIFRRLQTHFADTL